MFVLQYKQVIKIIILFIFVNFIIFVGMEKEQLHFSMEGNDKNNYSIYYKCTGRLGNMLFQFSSIQGIAMTLGRHSVFNPDMKFTLKKLFPNITIDTFKKIPRLEIIKQKHVWYQDKRLYNLPVNDVQILGYMQSYKYFEEHKEKLNNNIFRFNSFLSEKAKTFIDNAKVLKNATVSVCMHIRRGDRASQEMAQRGCIVPDVSDLTNVMDHIKIINKQVIFILASDDKEWVQRNILRNDTTITSSYLSIYEDFVIMSSCDHMVMTIGTFGWWAGWFTYMRTGHVYYFYNQYRKNSKLDKGFFRDHAFPLEWISYNKTTIK